LSTAIHYSSFDPIFFGHGSPKQKTPILMLRWGAFYRAETFSIPFSGWKDECILGVLEPEPIVAEAF